MVFGKSILKRVAAPLFAAAVALLGVWGCGGETGGTPNGIAGALTNATIKVSSFALTTSSAVNDLIPVNRTTLADDSGAPGVPEDLQSVAGALYPTRNSRSYRVVLKGAGVDREDVTTYFNIFNPAEPIYPNPPTSGPSTDGLRTVLTPIFVAPRPDTENPVLDPNNPDPDTRPSTWPVSLERQSNGTSVVAYTDTHLPVPADRPVFRVNNAFSYAQPDNKKAVRIGRRSVIVQFFTDDATGVKTHYDTLATIRDKDEAAANETLYLSQTLTNSYVFTTQIEPNQALPLTGGFAANNGDNGLVDSGKLDITAKGLPARWGSVKFEAYEETVGLNKPAIVFTKIFNLTDIPTNTGGLDFPALVASGVTAPSSVGLEFPFANRQRILKIYATCYELPDATGAVLAQTQEDGHTYNQDTFPVVFIPTVQAQAVNVYPNEVGKNAKTLLANMNLAPAISNVKATVPAVGQANPQTIAVTAVSAAFTRFAYDGDTRNLSPNTLNRTLNNVGILFTIAPVAQGPADDVYNLPGVLDTPGLPTGAAPGPTPGLLFWKNPPTPAKFSQLGFTGTSFGALKPATLIQFENYFGGTYRFPALIVPNQGTGGGVIRGGAR